jgi:hypothetical protein
MRALLYPRLRAAWLPAILRCALSGALLAGLYGVLHDQITYSISPEYFTRLKFSQFHYANFGLPPRVFVAEIGFLAAWWVGLIAGWFIARVAVPAFPPAELRPRCLQGFTIIFACAFAASLVGFGLGLLHRTHADSSSLREFASSLGVVDLPNFVRVAYIHNASYLGALLGLILATIHLRHLGRRASRAMGAMPCAI